MAGSNLVPQREIGPIPSADSANNNNLFDVVGQKNDTVAGTSLVGLVKAIKARTDATTATGTYEYTDAGGEQTVVEITPSDKTKIIQSIWLDLSAITKDNNSIKLYFKIDGTNYKEFDSFTFNATTDPDGYFIPGPFAIDDDFKVTYTEGVDEAAARNIIYRVVYENKEE